MNMTTQTVNTVDEQTSLLEFPCSFPIKVFGAAVPELEQAVLHILQKHTAEFDPSSLILRPSKGGRYYALTITIEAASQAQLDALYRDLSAHELVIMTL